MLPALIVVLFMSVALAASVYAIRQAGEHGHDVRDAVLLLLVLGGLVAALGTATLFPERAMGRAAQPEMQGIRV
jgi:formate hydrogenlyase subunit 3/multisubunit Na+/H+ antiporter MnhD subunit